MLNTKTFCVKIRFFLSICRASSKCLLNSRELHTQVGNNFHILLQQLTDTLHKICSIKKKPLFDLHLLAHTQTICDDIRRDTHSGNNHKQELYLLNNISTVVVVSTYLLCFFIFYFSSHTSVVVAVSPLVPCIGTHTCTLL